MLLSLKNSYTGDLPVNTATIWRAALERLEQGPIDAVCKTWLREAQLSSSASSADAQEQEAAFILQVSSDQARDMLHTRWRTLLEETLIDIVGLPITLIITHPSMEDVNGRARSFASDSARPSSESTTRSQRTQEPPTYSSFASDAYEVGPRSTQTRSGSASFSTEGRYTGGFGSSEAGNELLEEWDNEQRANILAHNRLNSRYTFDAFIVGNSNRLAHAASLAVAEAPGESYNPLFLYGGVGLGKTHLLHAIGHQGVLTGFEVLYVSSEQFTNEIVNAIRYRTTEEFRAKYRSVDILLVDDIQFIAGKESTEEEFFHTFNSLYEMSKQIVICSDRPPKAIVSLEERLRSRFEWGLIADIQPPDLETRMAILRVKADLLHYRVPDDIIAYIASRVQTNIRELEGCLNRLMAYQQLHRTELTMEVARAAMSSLGNDVRESHLTSRQIAQAVAEYYHVSLEAMCGKQRDKYIVMPRQIAMYLIRQETQASLLEIGQLFGGRDHSTVLHAYEKIDRSINLDPALRREIIAIREQLLHE